MKKKDIILPILLIGLLSISNAVAQTNLPQEWGFSSELSEGDTFSWDVVTLKENGSTVNEPLEESFPITEGSTIDVEITGDISNANLFDDSYTSSDYFTLSIDGENVDLSESFSIILFVYPVEMTYDNGTTINLFEESVSSGFEGEIDGNEFVSTTADETDFDGELRWEVETGVLNSWTGSSNDGENEVEISRNSGIFSSLPISPIWAIVPLLAIPIIRSKVQTN